MGDLYRQLEQTCSEIRQRTDFIPAAGIVLGSGLGGFAERVQVRAEIPYEALSGFPTATVPGHDGRLIFGEIGDTPVILMKGRIHYYEGYPMEQVVFPIRLIRMLGAEKLLLTNAAGSINTGFRPGQLMLITDHISAFVPSPLRGENPEALGPRFPDMSHVYSPRLQAVIRKAAQDLGIGLQQGVYVQWQGPNFETPAEIRMLRCLGADAVGMSTACEAIAARHMGMEVAGISCLTNMAAGILNQPLSHEEVQVVANQVRSDFERLLLAVVRSL